MPINTATSRVYWNVKDCIFNTTSTLVDILSETLENFKPARVKKVDQKEVNAIFSSNEFWEKLALSKGIENLFEAQSVKSYNHRFLDDITGLVITAFENETITKGILASMLETLREITQKVDLDNAVHFDIASIDMTDCILIDTEVSNLTHSNATLKILLTNNQDTDYYNSLSNHSKEDISDIYIAHDLREVEEILNFNAKYTLAEL